MELATLVMKHVHVHRATGRSSPFPDWLLQKYQSALKERRPMMSKIAPQVRAELVSNEIS